MNRKYAFLNFFLLCFALHSAAQQTRVNSLFDMMEDEGRNYYDVQKFADQFFQTVGKEKGTGYEQYKRWEYETKFWIDEQGKRLNPQDVFNDVNSHKAAYNEVRAQSIPWTELGPDYWNRTSGWNPGVGRIDAIAVDPSDENIIYIGSPEGGCWKSTDQGLSWNSLTDGLTFMRIGHVAVDPNNGSVVYIGTAGAGMLKSPDGGTTLTPINTGLSSTLSVKKIIVDPANSNHVIIATTSGIYNTTTGGASWTKTSSVSTTDLEFKPGDSQIVYACGNDFYRSTNGGTSFTKITSGITDTDAMRIAVTPANPNVVCIVQCNGSVFGSFYRSVNAGVSFITTVVGNSSAGTNFFGYSPNGTDTKGQGSYNIGVCISPDDENLIHIAGVITWRSYDGGYNWDATTEWNLPNSTGYTHSDIHSLEYFGSLLYVGGDGGISYSIDDGTNFTDLSAGMGIRMFYRLAGSKSDPVRIAVGAQDNGCSVRKSTGWVDWLGADGMECAIDPTNANVMYGSTQNGALYRTSNGGNSYTSLTEPETGNWVTPYLIDPNNPGTLYVGYEQIYKLTNSGNNWTVVSNFTGTTKFDCIAISEANSQYLYASRTSLIYRTVDGGANWTSINSGLGSATINSIAVHPSSPDKIAVAVSGSKIYTSVNGGTTWTNITGNFPAVSARCLVYEKDAGEGIYVGTNSGVYYKNNTMPNWVPFADGLPLVAVNELEIQDSIHKLRAATYGRGVWESDLYDIATETKQLLSMSDRLTIFPNPSTGTVFLQGADLESGLYNLTCETVTGQTVYSKEIRVNKNENTEVNLHTLVKGMYYLKLKSADYLLVKKVLIQ